MIFIDANILAHAAYKDAPQHRRAKSWLETALDAAFDVLDSWLEQPSVIIVDPGSRHRAILRGLLSAIGTGGNLTSDAHLAALALEHRAELCSFDTDFGRFRNLKWRNPLA